MKTKLRDREDYVEDQEIKLENDKEEQLNQLKETLEAKENEIRFFRERQVEKDEDLVSYFRQGTHWMDKEQRLAERTKNCEQEEAIAETASKLADKTRELNARKKTWTDARGSKTPA